MKFPFAASAILALAMASPAPVGQSRRRLHGRFLHITDLHPDEFYKVGSDPAHGNGCHRGHGPAGFYGAEKTGCDSPWSLINATFDWIARNVKDDVDFVVWTGDSARHGGDDEYPRDAAGILESNRAVAAKFLDTFSDPDGRLSVPVVPNLGNNDFLPHNTLGAGPNSWFRAYGDVWKRFIPDEHRRQFRRGGWFAVDVVPGRLAVISLNTMFFFQRNDAVDGCARLSEPGYEHMEWLRRQLQRLREAGMKAILMGHVPPARTDSKQNWDETCWQRYTLWLRQYRDVVTASLYGHMNIDHFVLQDTKDLSIGGHGGDDDDDDDDDEDDDEDEDEDEDDDDDDGDDDDDEDDDDDDDEEEDGRRLHVQSKRNYLQELRDEWSDLPDSIVGVLDGDDDERKEEVEEEDGARGVKGVRGVGEKKSKKQKYGKIGGKFAQRYHVSLVSPSVVPNYFPTLRIVEYNISGLEQAPVWEEEPSLRGSEEEEQEQTHLELRRDVAAEETERRRKKKNNGKKKKDEHVDDDDDDDDDDNDDDDKEEAVTVVVPEAPAKESLPGPAHRAQPLTLTGYVQYYANLSRMQEERKDSPGVEYEVEYNTREDGLYRLRDLTVKRYLHLAYRMGRRRRSSSLSLRVDDDDDDEDDAAAAEGKEEEAIRRGGKKKKKKNEKKRKGKKQQRRGRKEEVNKTWIHFLRHAFVSTMSREELEGL
ncbi:hypothetical protein CP532_2562 [Ophiocordyceps camponoti-leonardi (nom. inval.)]|nr:hypothetical protein CP532_2562 [Ophiocordyceps camponoti-leonardi (nom. inval.)]